MTLTFQTFTNISDGTTIEEILEGLAQTTAGNLRIRYSVLVRTSGSRARDVALKVTKRNTLSLVKMKPGSYTARYRVEIFRGQTQVATTKFSPRTGFRISG